jgi:demethylmenaquinone methyltransferase/2-methoxy-6-polyprenyl-1,4-benzoquinol methylase
VVEFSVIETLQNPQFVKNTFAAIARRYDLANHVLSGGMDFLWRRRAAQIVRAWQPQRVLDLATGSGDLALTIQRACPNAEVIGADFCEPMLEQARKKGLRNTVIADAMRLPFGAGEFDVVTVAFGLRNMESWSGALREMARVLKPGGHMLILDFSIPTCALMRPLYRVYLHRVLPLVAAAVTRQKSAYEYLGASIEKFPQGEDMQRLIAANNFESPMCEPLTGGIVSLYTATVGSVAASDGGNSVEAVMP